MSLVELSFVVREDPWGMVGRKSIIGELLLSASDPLQDKKIGEAWCGTHSKRPALIKGSDQNLLKLIQSDPAGILGSKLSSTGGAILPFLFKILTIATPLSLQVHPDINWARRLSSKYPERYQDKTEKPELGIAITETTLLLGFRTLSEILDVISNQPPASEFFKLELENPSIEKLYRRLLTATQSELNFFNGRIHDLLEENNKNSKEEQLFLNLYRLFPEDLGPYQSFLLNLVTLRPGEGIFIPPNTVHAYLSGELLECMAASDFVIRAGLTTKEKDIQSLLDVIGYEPFSISKIVPERPLFEFSPYKVPTAPFYVEKLTGRCASEVTCMDSPIIYFCLRGSGQIRSSETTLEFVPGTICLVYAGSKHLIGVDGEFYRISAKSGS